MQVCVFLINGVKCLMIKFTWDPVKNEKNEEKHGVTFETATEVFDDYFHFTLFDSASSSFENRYQTIGITRDGRVLVIIHADDYSQNLPSNVEVIRIISARIAEKYEKRLYESERQQL